ncbi:MAG: glycosyltransferase family 10 domain-containing protein [Gemmatimonadaceae bacterium]
MSLSPTDITLCIDPFSYHFERDQLFGADSARGLGADTMNAPYLHLRDWFAERGVRVHTADRLMRGEVGGKRNIVMSFGLRGRYHALGRRDDVVLSTFFAFESPVVDPKLYRAFPDIARHFKRLYSFSDADSLVPVVGQRVEMLHFEIPYPIDRIRDDLFDRTERKFLVVINHNKLPPLYWNELYTERMRAVEFFARTKDIDLYGKAWEGPAFLMGIPPWVPGRIQHAHRWMRKQWQRVRPDPLLVAARTVYRGFVPDKLATLGEYTFSLCFENVVVNGWITEKLFDCFVTGTIPIFLGAPDVKDYVPRECFIDMRDFANYEELRKFLKAVSPSEIARYKEAMRAYMASESFKRFGNQRFTELIGRLVEEDSGVSLGARPSPRPVTGGRVS